MGNNIGSGTGPSRDGVSDTSVASSRPFALPKFRPQADGSLSEKSHDGSGVNAPGSLDAISPFKDFEVYRALSDKITEAMEVGKKDLDALRVVSKNDLDVLRKETEDKLEKTRISIIETIGIFVALFTFISIEFNVFRIYSAWQAVVGLSLVLLGSITFLVLIFHSFLLRTAQSGSKQRDAWGLIETVALVSSVAFISGGAFLVARAPMEMDTHMSESIDSRMRDSIYAERQETQKNLDVTKGKVDLLGERVDAGDTKLRECVVKFGVIRQCFE